MSPSEKVGYRVRVRPGQGLPSKLNNCQEQVSQRNGAFPYTEGTEPLLGLCAGQMETRQGWRWGRELKEVEVGTVLLW